MTTIHESRAAIGIDLGTTYSCVGVWQRDRVEIIPNDQGKKTTPAFVAFTEIESLVGNDARKQLAINPTNTIFDAKCLIGKIFSEAFQSNMKLWPYQVIAGPAEKPMISVTYKGVEKQFDAEEFFSMVLVKMKEIADAYLGSDVKNVVITAPSHFSDSQRLAIQEAAVISGLDVLCIINGSTAAAIAYGLDKKSVTRRNVLIFDLGGATLDVSLLTIEDGIFEVKATIVDPRLGGRDFDNRLVDYFVAEFEKKHKKDMRENPSALWRLRTSCERAKMNLSDTDTSRTTIEMDSLFEDTNFRSAITRAKFEELNKDLFMKCIMRVKECLRSADMDKRSVNDVVLVGGSCKIPKIQQILQEFFNGKELRMSIRPDEVVAYGAAIKAAIMNGETNVEKVLAKTSGGSTTSRAMEYKSTIQEKGMIKYMNKKGGIASKNALGGAAIKPAIMNGETNVEKVLAMTSGGSTTFRAMEYKSTIQEKGMIVNINQKAEIASKNALGNYAYYIWKIVREPNICSKLSPEDKKKIEDAIEQVVQNVESNQVEEADESEVKRIMEKLESICKPMIAKMCPSTIPEEVVHMIITEQARDISCSQHKLKLKNFKKEYRCDGCKVQGIGLRYRCNHCPRELHPECTFTSPTACHESFKDSTFTLLDHPTDTRHCDACGKVINGFVYHCKKWDWDMHPRCLNLKSTLTIDGQEFILNSPSYSEGKGPHGYKASSKCIYCSKRKLEESEKTNIRGWSYVSKDDKYCHIHVYCANEKMIEDCKSGSNSSKSLASKNQKVGVQGLYKKISGGGGRGKLLNVLNLFLDVVLIVAGLVLGSDPILALIGLSPHVVNLLSKSA